MITKTNGWLLLASVALSGISVCPSVCHGQLRICSYNTLSKPANSTDIGEIRTIFSAIATRPANGVAKRVDIVGLQEQNTSLATVSNFASALNAEFPSANYQQVLLSNGSFRHAYVYDAGTVTPVSSSEVYIGIRPALRTQWNLFGYGGSASFYSYCVHLKAGNSAGDNYQRNLEAQNIRSNADALGEGTHVIYMGDFNFVGHNESSVLTLYAPGPGQAVDPLLLPTWPGVSSRFWLTQSTRDIPLPDGGAFGGIDDRFDLQLVSGEFLDGEGLSYLGFSSSGFPGFEHSYIAFGNDGLVYNGPINVATPGREQPYVVLDALYELSDHLPVVADYQIPAVMDVQMDSVPYSAVLGSTVDVAFLVKNTAPVSVSLAADELDYSFVASAGLVGAGSGVEPALGAGQFELIQVDTTSVGLKTANLTVSTNSQQAANPNFAFDQEIFVTVQGDMNGDFSVDTLDIVHFADALVNPSAYAQNFPHIDPNVIGDFNGDSVIDSLDISGFSGALVGP